MDNRCSRYQIADSAITTFHEMFDFNGATFCVAILMSLDLTGMGKDEPGWIFSRKIPPLVGGLSVSLVSAKRYNSSETYD
ncbi:Hypothetical protein NTJ_12169 [Nesidiocoris tenuis]|uniref:Uncharacterized protein n=1 Tax=Nesidiocoris tenuis TaxID=355587 RepID=A0ABN7B975_9HEMI|nr:Hypothetical protein NTJ_12169 [Nesidiocoris tenuis]